MSAVQKQPPVLNGHEDTKRGSKKGVKPELELDVSKLHSLASEQQDLYLFTFMTGLEAYTKTLSTDALKEQQTHLKKELLQIISLQHPLPNRTVRNTVGRCLTYIFTKGDRRLLFESITELGDLLTVGKGDKEIRNKHAAVHCLGEIYKAAGDGAINLSSLTSTALVRLIKAAANHVGLRSAIFRTLGKITESVSHSLDETIARDIFKQARSAASSDRGAPVQISACWCLQRLVQRTTHFNNTNDFESLKTTMWTAGDCSNPAVRNASAACLASVLVKGYTGSKSATVMPRTPKLKRPRKLPQGQSISMADGEDSDATRLASPTWKKSSMQLELTLPEILSQLCSHYVRPSTSNRGRAAIICCYAKVLQSLTISVVESQFGMIAEHFLVDVLSNTAIAHHRFRLLLTRRLVQKLLADVVCGQILGEVDRISAARFLINEFLKNYPRVLKEKAEPSKNTLTGVLNLLAFLIKSLGSAFNPLVDSCRDGLIQVLQHPSYTVQIHASYCLRLFISVCPQQLIQCASICLNSVNRELALLSTARQSARRCIGYANGLAAILSVSNLHPLYSSIEISSRVFQQATNLLKSSANAELRVSGTQVQVAWILIGGLMPLGPNFVKIHISQLLLLWRNALPRALTKENAGQRHATEISFLIHVRECALGSILSFLEFNGRLLTPDVSKRVASMLQNTVNFLEHLPETKTDGDLSPRIVPSLQLQDLVQMVRRRVLQCFTRLAICSPYISKELLSNTNILAFTVSCFAEPEGYNQGSLGTSIANSGSNFDSIWNVTDNYAFGVSGCMRGFKIDALPGEHLHRRNFHWYQTSGVDEGIEDLISSPICGAREHDFVYVYSQSGNDESEALPDPPATEIVNSAINLFAMALPLQEPKIQESTLEQLHTFLVAKSLLRDVGRRAAIVINIALAVLGSVKVGRNETLAIAGEIRSPVVEKCLEDLLQALIIDQDQYVRNAACEALGRLCNGSGSTFTTNVVQALVDIIVSNREPNARAGCAMALGSIHSNVGGMAAGFHLRKIHGVLMSLCSDPHPTVHFWAIDTLSRVAESAGLTFSGYLPSTLGLVTQLWLSDTHCEEADSVGTANAETLLTTPAAIAHTMVSLINVLGPDLQDMSKARDLIITLVRQFDLDDLPLVQGQALQCWQHIYLYAPSHVNLTKYVGQLQRGLDSEERLVREIAVDGLYGLMRQNAEHILGVAAEGFEDQIWNTLDTSPDQDGVRSIVRIWLNQTSLTQTARWISRCQEILTRTVTRDLEAHLAPETKTQASAAPDMQDEEVAGFALGDNKDDDSPNGTAGQELLKWQIRAFAVQCLNDVLVAVARELHNNPKSSAGLIVQQRVSDIIRMAFLASTSSVIDLRIRGLKLIDQILIMFGRTPDPDFAEALLLEQYQAQISSALTPAFGADSSPELASTAVSVCATFIATGLVTDVERMGRILKLLISALGSFTVETGDPSIGDLKGLSSNAQTMVRMAVLSAWAELQVASKEQAYLVQVMEPQVAILTPLWLSSLHEFARLRFEPDISSTLGMNPDDGLDTVYAALNRQTLLKFYQDSWLKLVDAIASLIDQDSDFVFDALDGKDGKANGSATTGNGINYRDEPVAFFFVLFGLVIDALITQPGTGSSDGKDDTLEILLALKKILRPSVSGHAIYQDTVFSETMDLFDRLVLTEGLPIQAVIVDITRNLCLSHPSVGQAAEGDEHLSDEIEQLFELTRVTVLVLVGILPNLVEHPTNMRHHLSSEAVALVILSLEALVDVSDVFPSLIRADLHACIFHIFTTILGTSVCQAAVVPKMLPVFKRFIQNVTDGPEENPALANQLRSSLQRLRSILANAQRRESDVSLRCARNTLMASVILLTSGSHDIPPDESLVNSLLIDLLDCLSDRGLGKVAAGCVRTLLLVETKTETGEAISRFLLPRLLHFISDTSQEDPDNARGAVSHCLDSFVATLEGEEASTALCVFIPVLLEQASAQGKDAYREVAARLLSLASRNQESFRGVVTKMNIEQRSIMQEVIREGGLDGRDNRPEKDDHGEPSIALKLSFGGS